MVSSGFEADNPEDHSKGEAGLSARNGAQDVCLGSALRGESPGSAVEFGDGFVLD